MRRPNRNDFASLRFIPRALFPTVNLAPAKDGQDRDCLAVMLGLLPIAMLYPEQGAMAPIGSDAMYLLAAISLELDGFVNPDAAKSPDVYSIDTFLLGLTRGQDAMESFAGMVERSRAKRSAACDSDEGQEHGSSHE